MSMQPGIWWLASYPKSGNTWLRTVLTILVSGKPLDINDMGSLGVMGGLRFAFDDALGINTADLSFEEEANLRPRVYEIWAAEAERPLYCKVHDACHLAPSGEPLFPVTATRGAVYVVRDPRAVAVSYANHGMRPIEEIIARMDTPTAMMAESPRRLARQLRQRLLRWSDHVESWLNAPFPVHLLRYEDMKTDPHAAFAGVARFLDLPCTSEAIAAAVDATTFSRLQARERDVGFSEKPWNSAAFFREGTIDGWRRSLTPEQATRITASHGAVMRRLGYDVTLAPFASEQQDLVDAQ
jgi:aryl sulfotransferase